MARPIRIPRALASRALGAAPVHASCPVSALRPASHRLVTFLATQKRQISQQTPHWAPQHPNQDTIHSHTSEAIVGSASQQAKDPDTTIKTETLKGMRKWEIQGGGEEMLTGKTIALTHSGLDSPTLLDRHWLRDGCGCSACVDPHSGQKNFGTTDVPLDLPISSCRKTENGALEIIWQNDFLTSGRESHTSTYPAELVDFFFSTFRHDLAAPPRMVLWDKQTINRDLMSIDYNDWVNNDEALGAGVRMLHSHGIILIRNAPHSEESVISMSSRIGNLKETLYGRTWDVRSKPNAENVAYTSSFLGLHQDMLYLKDPPRLQLLHCLENSCEGGESLFSDSARAAYLLNLGPLALRALLGSTKVIYHYKKHGHWYQREHPIIDEKMHVRWSPPFQAPLATPFKSTGGSIRYRMWVEAAIKFRELLEREEFLFEFKMKPGDCVIFDNLRVVHGRRAFDTSAGSRWLKGAYNDSDVFSSKLAGVTRDPVGEEVPSLHEQALALNETYKIWDRPRKASSKMGNLVEESPTSSRPKQVFKRLKLF